MTHPAEEISLRKAAFVGGLAILVMAIAMPFAEFFVYQKLVLPGKPADTVQNIVRNESLFRYGILCYMTTFLCDIPAAWAFYYLLKPVNGPLALLTAWLRLVYAAVNLTGLLHLIAVLRLLTTSDYAAVLEPAQWPTQVMLSLRAFRNGWSFTFILFGIYLGLLGYLVFKSGYIPRLLGILLIVAGLGYLIDNLQPFLLPDFAVNSNLVVLTGTFEILLAFWLLIKGSRLHEPDERIPS